MGDSARYEVIEETDDHLTIRDVGPWNRCLTVTNDAERVVKALAPLLHGRRLYCVDSEGILGELLVNTRSEFMGFRPT